MMSGFVKPKYTWLDNQKDLIIQLYEMGFTLREIAARKKKNKDSCKMLYRTMLYLEYEHIKKLQEIAAKENTTLTALVNRAIKEYLERKTEEEVKL